MKTIQEVATEAAQIVVFENPETLVMLNIIIVPKELPKGTKPYNVEIPKAFLEEIYAIGVRDGQVLDLKKEQIIEIVNKARETKIEDSVWGFKYSAEEIYNQNFKEYGLDDETRDLIDSL